MIPVSEPVLGRREQELAAECLASGWISSAGRYIDEFETAWAAYCGRRHGIAVSNGTVALELAVAGLDLQPGDEVIVPSFTIISCVMAIVTRGAVPVLVDADPDTWCMDVTQVEARITARTRAIMAVHIYGHPVDMDPLVDIARRHRLAIVEDAAEAHGAEYMSSEASGPTWRRCGSFGDVSTFSFYANKIVTTGEGGMVLTDDDALAARYRSLRNLAFKPERRFEHDELGFNFRFTNIQAAIGVAQVEHIDETLGRKREIAAAYTTAFMDLPGLQVPSQMDWAKSVYWMYGLVIRDGRRTAAHLASELREAGIDTRPFFLGMHRQPALLKRGWFKGEHFPITDRLAEYGFYLPSGPRLTDEDMEKVIRGVRRLFR